MVEPVTPMSHGARVVRMALFISLMVACSAGHSAKELAHKLDREFRRSVPIGSSKSAVITFLRAHQIAYHDEPSLRTITASIPNVEHGFLATFGIYMKFDFDNMERLENYDIRAVGTGL